ncbi:hypothetical protein HTZ97_06330 [Desulfuromonas acetoxidans]|uniref:Lipoprotein, putative n=1 Tax=Desulfuromonas acetoxidans (strain DSM 684 / 11070) TaxID=281689 RepID=Q1K1J1_DESA6|nr:lipoprotein, putative [Desulfuromonas acetoxidans]EAT16397.1 lipoprotein, putative [Desulfuromonas acetoxidans DSM 684]MBF0644341.1 hypothetical protein [Desulfuromonas acetoxidans]NVD23536.1 hypothetical protein [Desulfuromonas acetoxidans]NVE16079.1 hypothetical protein [Desulfuromonas acetoxidans]
MNYAIRLLLIAVLLCAGCAKTGHHYTDPAVGLGYIKKIAILPLENFTARKGIEERSRELLTTRILGHGLYEVVEKGELHRFLRDEIRSNEKELIDQRVAKRMAREFNIEAYIAGSVDEFTEVRNGSYTYPEIAISLRMVDIKTGNVVWKASHHANGYSTAGRLFGLTAEDTNSVLFRLIDDLLATLSES